MWGLNERVWAKKAKEIKQKNKTKQLKKISDWFDTWEVVDDLRHFYSAWLVINGIATSFSFAFTIGAILSVDAVAISVYTPSVRKKAFFVQTLFSLFENCLYIVVFFSSSYSSLLTSLDEHLFDKLVDPLVVTWGLFWMFDSQVFFFLSCSCKRINTKDIEKFVLRWQRFENEWKCQECKFEFCVKT